MHLKSASVKVETNESDGYAQSPLHADECIQRASAALVNAAVCTHLCLQKHLTDACSSFSASRCPRWRVRCGLFWGQGLRSVNVFLCAAQRVESAATRASGHSVFLREVRSGKLRGCYELKICWHVSCEKRWKDLDLGSASLCTVLRHTQAGVDKVTCSRTSTELHHPTAAGILLIYHISGCSYWWAYWGLKCFHSQTANQSSGLGESNRSWFPVKFSTQVILFQSGWWEQILRLHQVPNISPSPFVKNNPSDRFSSERQHTGLKHSDYESVQHHQLWSFDLSIHFCVSPSDACWSDSFHPALQHNRKKAPLCIYPGSLSTQTQRGRICVT